LPIHLSPRQREVLTKLIQGKPNKTIGQELGISDVTVKTHVIAVLSALGVSNRTEAVYRAAFLGALLH
jgi:DNA-binding NarL/FixJ family response regulator